MGLCHSLGCHFIGKLYIIRCILSAILGMFISTVLPDHSLLAYLKYLRECRHILNVTDTVSDISHLMFYGTIDVFLYSHEPLIHLFACIAYTIFVENNNILLNHKNTNEPVKKIVMNVDAGIY